MDKKRFWLKFFGWTFILDIPLFALILLMALFTMYIRTYPQEPYFDLFLTRVFLENEQSYFRSTEWLDEEQRLKVKWDVNEDQLRNFEPVEMKITNSGDHFYALVSDFKQNFWIHIKYITYTKNGVDTLMDGMWCGTGLFLQRIEVEETIDYTWEYSLYDKLTRETEPDTFDHLSYIDEIFGDSTSVYWELSTYSTPFSDYVSQKVCTPSFMLYPDELKKTWASLND